jgi:hypothetical protein
VCRCARQIGRRFRSPLELVEYWRRQGTQTRLGILNKVG